MRRRALRERPIRFLHLADIHLGFRQYNDRERERDFFLAFESAVERFALPLEEGGPPQVDFVLIAGDLFDSRSLQPITLSRASYVLSLLRDAQIPVFAIEGNHDAARWYRDQEPNWYDYLCGEGMMVYLRDVIEDGELQLLPWNEEARQGSYIDFEDQIRIVGTHWYGATAHTMVGQLEAALRTLPPMPFTIMMFHGGLTDYVNEMHAGVAYEQLLPLRPHVQYLAMGHVHKQYERQNWVFNPGGLEASKIREYFESHGLYIIEVGAEGITHIEHRTDYRRRPFIYLQMDCDLHKTPQELAQAVRELVEGQGVSAKHQIEATRPADLDAIANVCLLEFTGALGFPFSQVPLDELEPWIKTTLGSYLFRCTNDTTPLDYGQDDSREQNGRIDRQLLEKKVFQALIHQNTRYRPWSAKLATYASDLKIRLLDRDIKGEELDDLLALLDEILQSQGEPEMPPESTDEAEDGAQTDSNDATDEVVQADSTADDESAQTDATDEAESDEVAQAESSDTDEVIQTDSAEETQADNTNADNGAQTDSSEEAVEVDSASADDIASEEAFATDSADDSSQATDAAGTDEVDTKPEVTRHETASASAGDRERTAGEAGQENDPGDPHADPQHAPSSL